MKKYLILYSYYETGQSIQNLNYFLDHTLLNIKNNVTYIFIINNYNCSLIDKIKEKQENIIIYKRKNENYDFGAWAEYINLININKYNYFIFLNDTVLGPFVNNEIWYKKFTSKINDKVKLVGSSINFKPVLKNYKNLIQHVKSYAWATDSIGLKILIKNDILFNIKFINKFDFIFKYEIGLSRCIIDNGYQIDSLNENNNKNVFNSVFIKNRK